MPSEPSAASVRRELAIDLIDKNRRLMGHATTHPYKRLLPSEGELVAHIFVPTDWSADDRRTGMVFFHSSQWDHGNISQFAPHAMFFASRGAVCILAEYRMDGMPLRAMADVRSAIRWTRENATFLGIDASKVVASGGSCGAHAAACAAMCDDEAFDDPSDHAATSCVPDALVLFSPVLDTSKKGFGHGAFADAKTAARANPLKHIRPGLPPMLLFHGSSDQTVPVLASQKFAKKMQRKKNACHLFEFGGEAHGFFNFNVNDRNYHATVDATDDFLVSLGFLTPPEPN